MTHNPLLVSLTLNPVKKGSTEQEEALGVETEAPDGRSYEPTEREPSPRRQNKEDDDLGAWLRLGAATDAKLAERMEGAREANSSAGWKPPAVRKQPDAVAPARRLRRKRPKGGQRSLREMGYVNERGKPIQREVSSLDAGSMRW